MDNLKQLEAHIQEIENKIKTTVDLEQLKKIRAEINKLETPKLQDIIDVSDIEKQLWDKFRFSTTDVRHKAFFNLIDAECESALHKWEQNIFLIKNMQKKIEDEIIKLEVLLNEAEHKLLENEKNKEIKENKLHSLKHKFISYEDSDGKSKKYKNFNIAVFLIISLILALGTAISLNKIGNTGDEILKSVTQIENTSENKSKKIQNTEKPVVNSAFAVVQQDASIQSKKEVKNQPKKEINNSKEAKNTNSFNLLYVIMSLVFLAAGKVASLVYDNLRQPKGAYFILAPLFFLAFSISLYSFLKLESFGVQQNNIIANYNKYLKLDNYCQNRDDIAWSTDATDKVLDCLAISVVKTTDLYKSNNDKISTEKRFATDFFQRLKVANKANFTEMDDFSIKQKASNILDKYKEYKKDVDNFKKMKEDTDFYQSLAKAMIILAEFLFSSMAWMKISEKFTSADIKSSIQLDMDKLEKELKELVKNNQITNSLISKIKDSITRLSSDLTEIQSLNHGIYDEETIQKKKDGILKICNSRAEFVLQGIEADILRRLAELNNENKGDKS